MKKIQIFAALLLFAWTMNAQTALDDAKKKIVNENYNEAKSILNTYIASEKDAGKQAEAYYWIGESEYRNLIDENPQQAMDKARDQYNKGLVLDKNSPQCLVGMGKLLLDKKNYELELTLKALLKLNAQLTPEGIMKGIYLTMLIDSLRGKKLAVKCSSITDHLLVHTDNTIRDCTLNYRISEFAENNALKDQIATRENQVKVCCYKYKKSTFFFLKSIGNDITH